MATKKISVDIDLDLYNKFNEMVRAEDLRMTQKLRTFIREYVSLNERLQYEFEEDFFETESMFDKDFSETKSN